MRRQWFNKVVYSEVSLIFEVLLNMDGVSSDANHFKGNFEGLNYFKEHDRDVVPLEEQDHLIQESLYPL